jgi:hypothetical protein
MALFICLIQVFDLIVKSWNLCAVPQENHVICVNILSPIFLFFLQNFIFIFHSRKLINYKYLVNIFIFYFGRLFILKTNDSILDGYSFYRCMWYTNWNIVVIDLVLVGIITDGVVWGWVQWFWGWSIRYNWW